MLSSICTGRRTTRGSTGAFNLSIEMFQRAAKLFNVPIEPVEIPFEGTSLPGYFYSAGPGKRPAVVVCSGFDGTVEENHFYGAAGFVERGCHVLSFDGPGQPGMMHREGMVFRHDWEVPTGAVLDCLLGQREGIDADRIALMGVSMGVTSPPAPPRSIPALRP